MKKLITISATLSLLAAAALGAGLASASEVTGTLSSSGVTSGGSTTGSVSGTVTSGGGGGGSTVSGTVTSGGGGGGGGGFVAPQGQVLGAATGPSTYPSFPDTGRAK